jgi:hypothetical protein
VSQVRGGASRGADGARHKTRGRATTLKVVAALKAADGHFINHFGRAATEEFARWQGPEPDVPSLMKH